MFDYSLVHWVAFFTASIVLVISPGPSVAYILSQVLKGSKKAGFSAMFGIWVGNAIHIAMAAAGLSAILATSAIAFNIIKWVGAVYLIWMGYNALKSKGGSYLNQSANDTVSRSTIDYGKVFRQSAIVATLNPKTALFFLTFLPQFIVVDAGPVWAQITLHGVLLTATGAVSDIILITGGVKLVNYLDSNKSFSLWVDRSIGAILVVLGIRLGFVER